MKALLLFGAILFGIAFAIPGSAELADASPPAADRSSDLEQLDREYARRRAEALRPVTMWYRAQLEVLGRKLEKEGAAVPEARARVGGTFWEDDQPELKQALLSRGWIWRSEMDATGVALKFSDDGSVHHVGLNGSWKITGPNEVTVHPDDDAPFVLRFNASLTTFIGDRRGVSGERKTRR